MVRESWKAQHDTSLDGALPSEEMHVFDGHVRICTSCAADALARVKMKRTVQVAGKRFTPSSEFRRRVQQSIAARPVRGLARFGWMIAPAMIAVLVVGGFAAHYRGRQ